MKTFMSTLAALLVGALSVGVVAGAQSKPIPVAGGISVLPVPVRIADTRNGDSVAPLQLVDRPVWATAVIVNVAVTEPDSAGYATLYDCVTKPATSNVNWTASGATEANLAIVPMTVPADMFITTGEICIEASTGAELVVDLVAWTMVADYLVFP